MKRIGSRKNLWRYELDEKEALCLAALLNEFPLAPARPSRISNAGADPESLEREQLLNQSLAEHRRQLKAATRRLIDKTRPGRAPGGRVIELDAQEREMLLQVLNDLRISCWQALGQPDNLELDPGQLKHEHLKHYHYMHLAGFFEYHLIQDTD